MAIHSVWLLGFAGLGALLLADQAHLVFGYQRHWVNEDHTLLWAAARDLGRLEFRQLNYYGMAYFTVFEAAPAELFRRLGMTLATGVPLGTALLMTGAWVVLAAAVWKHRPLLALGALAAPVVLSTEYLVASGSPGGRAAGTFIAAAGVAALLVSGSRVVLVAAGVGLSTLGVLWDFGSIFFVAPVLIHFACRHPWSRGRLGAMTAGSIPAALWVSAAVIYFRAYPDANLHRGAGFTPDASILGETLGHPERYFTWLAPELVRGWLIPVAGLAVLVVSLIATRRLAYILPAVCAGAGLIGALATPKALDGTASVYLGYSRFLLAVPLLAWFLAWLVADARILVPRPGTAGVVAVVIVVFAVSTAVVRAIRFDDQLAALRGVAVKTGVPSLVSTADVHSRCSALAEDAKRTEAKLAVFLYDRVSAYACSGLFSSPETLFPGYDRRAWRLRDEAARRRERFLIVDVDDTWCASIADELADCRATPTGRSVILTTGPGGQSVIALLNQIGVPVRDFEAPTKGG